MTHLMIHPKMSTIIPLELVVYRFVQCTDKRQKEVTSLTNGGLYSTTDCSLSELQTEIFSHTISNKNRTRVFNRYKKVIGHQLKSFSYVVCGIFFLSGAYMGEVNYQMETDTESKIL